MSHTTFDATITPDNADTSGTTIHTVLARMTDEDAAKFYGDMLRYSARLEWKLVVSPLPVDREQFVRDWYDHARRDDHGWSLHFPVTLVGRALVPAIMQGGMLAEFDCKKDQIPKYLGMSVHT